MSEVMVPKRITVHCTDTPNGQFIKKEALEAQHKARGFDTIGYHAYINPDGEWIDCRPLNQVGSHVQGHNTGNIGISLSGSDKFTREQFITLKSKVEDICRCFNIKVYDVFTHAQYDTAIKQGKSCPNISINKLMYFLVTDDYSGISEYILEGKK